MARLQERVIILYACAALSIVLAVWLRILLEPLLDGRSTFATLFLAVIGTAWFGGLRPALFAVALGAVGSSVFLLSSAATADASAQAGPLLVYLMTGTGIAILAGSLHAARHRAECAAASVRRQAHLIDQTYDAVLVWTWEHGLELWNGGAERMYGHRAEDVLGRRAADVLRTSARASTEDIHGALRAHGVWEGEVWHTHRSGHRVAADSRMLLVRDAGREYVLEVNRNIDDRVRVEQDLRDANERLEARVRERTLALERANDLRRVSEDGLRLLVEGVSEHVVVMLDAGGVIRTWNSGAEHIVGYTAADMVGRHYECLFTAEGIAEGMPAKELARAAAEGKVVVEGWRLRRNGSRFWAQGTLAAVHDEEGSLHGFAKVTRDLTAKRRNDQLLQSVLDNTLDGILCIEDKTIFGHSRPKPDARMFRHVVAKLKTPAHRCVLVQTLSPR